MSPPPTEKPGLHPRNRHRNRYDFPALVARFPTLRPFVAVNAWGDESIDFANPAAVRALNAALLASFYGIDAWDLPEGYLCPPIPGRADYVHHLADLLAGDQDGVVPKGPHVRVLDVGVGANVVYPIVGSYEYGWHFVGSEIDDVALAAARRIAAANPAFGRSLELRRQPDPSHLLRGIVRPGEKFDLTLCNPPFHASLEEAHEGSRRKWKNLGKAAPQGNSATPVLNFGGRGGELWCAGGESLFVRHLVDESALVPTACLWFTSLVSKEATLPGVLGLIRKREAAEVRTIDVAHGQKKSRIVAWTFLDAARRKAWAAARPPAAP